MTGSSAPELGRTADEPTQAIDLIVEEIRERMCSRLDVVAEKFNLTLEQVVAVLNDRHGMSYASDYEDWVHDSTTTANS